MHLELKILNKILTSKQLEVTNSIKELKPRHVIFHGAIRSGKTYLGILFWDTLVRSYKKKTFIMTGYTISSLKRNVLDDWSKLFGIETHLNSNNEFNAYGNKIACFGTDKSDSFKAMRGVTGQAWYANEVILSHQNSVLEAFGRCSEKGARVVWETNPGKPSHYIKKDYIDHSGERFPDGSLNIQAYHFRLDDNTFLPDNYIESLKTSIPQGVIYDRLIKGLWKVTDTAIYENYNIVQDLPKEERIDDYCYGLDFGFNHPTALVKNIYVDGELYIELCFCESRLITSDMVQKVKQCVCDKDKPIYCDCAEPDKIEALKREGFNAIPADKSKGTVLQGINKLKEYKIHLVYNPILIRQIENYEWRKNAVGEVLEEPVKADDDICDAIRYADFNHTKKSLTNLNESIILNTYNDRFEY